MIYLCICLLFLLLRLLLLFIIIVIIIIKYHEYTWIYQFRFIWVSGNVTLISVTSITAWLDDVKLVCSFVSAGSEHSWEDSAETVVCTSGFTTYHKDPQRSQLVSWLKRYSITLSDLEKYWDWIGNNLHSSTFERELGDLVPVFLWQDVRVMVALNGEVDLHWHSAKLNRLDLPCLDFKEDQGGMYLSVEHIGTKVSVVQQS